MKITSPSPDALDKVLDQLGVQRPKYVERPAPDVRVDSPPKRKAPTARSRKGVAHTESAPDAPVPERQVRERLAVDFTGKVPKVLRLTMAEWRSFWHEGFHQIAGHDDFLDDLLMTVAGRPYLRYQAIELHELPDTAEVIIQQGIIRLATGVKLCDLKRAVVFWQIRSGQSESVLVNKDDLQAVNELLNQRKRDRAGSE